MQAQEAESEAEREGEAFVRRLFSFQNESEDQRVSVRLIRGRFWIYRYDAAARLPEDDEPDRPVVKEQPAAETRRRRRTRGREVPGLRRAAALRRP